MKKSELYNANRREKYASDKQHREKIKSRRRKAYTVRESDLEVTSEKEIRMMYVILTQHPKGVKFTYNTSAVAHIVNKSVATVRRWIRNKQIPSVESGYSLEQVVIIANALRGRRVSTFSKSDKELVQKIQDGFDSLL